MTRDEKIAEWMGWKCPLGHEVNDEACGTRPPAYDTDPAAFLELRKKLLGDGWFLESWANGDGVSAVLELGGAQHSATAPTEPEALAMAVERMLEDRPK